MTGKWIAIGKDDAYAADRINVHVCGNEKGREITTSGKIYKVTLVCCIKSELKPIQLPLDDETGDKGLGELLAGSSPTMWSDISSISDSAPSSSKSENEGEMEIAMDSSSQLLRVGDGGKEKFVGCAGVSVLARKEDEKSSLGRTRDSEGSTAIRSGGRTSSISHQSFPASPITSRTLLAVHPLNSTWSIVHRPEGSPNASTFTSPVSHTLAASKRIKMDETRKEWVE